MVVTGKHVGWVEEELDGLRLWRGHGAGLDVALLPEVGGKIISLRSASGREWLWQTRRRPFQRLTYGASFEDQDISGFDECFPGIGAGPYPAFPWQGTAIPDHGELWTLPWESILEGDTLVLRVHGVRFPYQLEKRLTLEQETATLRINYRLTNLAPFPLRYLWSAHPLFAVRPGMRVLLPDGVRVRVDWSKYDRLGPFGSEHAWPRTALAGGGVVALDRLPDAGADTADKLYTDRLPERADAGWCALHDPVAGEYLALRFDARRVPYIGVWLNMDAWPLQPREGEGPCYNAALEPCTGFPDLLDRAVARDEAATLAANGINRWTLRLEVGQGEVRPGGIADGEER
jgi:galactose mutarotase-like enzyme